MICLFLCLIAGVIILIVGAISDSGEAPTDTRRDNYFQDPARYDIHNWNNGWYNHYHRHR
jgi:hypothetical protein